MVAANESGRRKAQRREHGRKHEKLNANTTITNRNTAQQREKTEGEVVGLGVFVLPGPAIPSLKKASLSFFTLLAHERKYVEPRK